MTVVFSNSSNAVWRAIQEALGTAGFVVADVRTLDKQQGSFHQVTSTAVKQDLVISAYKPTEALAERFALGTSSPENAWAFVTEHLGHVPIFSSVGGVADVIAERTAQVLHDRMVAFHVQRQLSVPLSTAEFLGGLNQRYPERDGMYFLPTQVTEYDRKRNTAAELRQLSLFVVDEVERYSMGAPRTSALSREASRTSSPRSCAKSRTGRSTSRRSTSGKSFDRTLSITTAMDRCPVRSIPTFLRTSKTYAIWQRMIQL